MVEERIDEDVLADVVAREFPAHPFESEIPQECIEITLRQYLAMSQSFPHIQAGAHGHLLEHSLKRGCDVPVDVEITTAVGSFLVCDETGVWNVLRENGIAGLPRILNTQGFHVNLLKADIEQILGKSVAPLYSSATRHYLKELSDGLSDPDPIVRCAWMVSFETHAERMISGLWDTVTKLTSLTKECLRYFQTHVGGDDPAEAYHVAMTTGMIAKLVPAEERGRFINEFKKAYAVHFDWCGAIAKS